MKKILIGFTVFVAVLIAAVLVVPGFIDWSGYRAEIAQKVKELTGRDLVVGGDIVFRLVPSPTLSVGDIRFANADGASQDDMVAIRQLDVQVALMPLIAGTVHVNSIRMIEPVIRLEMLPNGQGNWVLGEQAVADPVPDTPAQSTEPEFKVDDTPQDTALPIQIDDFIIEKGHLVYIDAASGVREEITDLNSRFAIAALNGPFEAVGTMKLRGIPVGFETTVGQIVHGRTASFATQINFAHGETSARVNGTLVHVSEGPKVKTRLDVKGKSLAGLLSAFSESETLPGGLDRSFAVSGDVSLTQQGVVFENDGLDISLGDDRGRIALDVSMAEKKVIKAAANFSKIDGDRWMTAEPYKVVEPEPLALVIEPSEAKLKPSGRSVSAALSPLPSDTNKPEAANDNTVQPTIPKDIDATVSLNVDAIVVKGQPIRQLQSSLSVVEGEVALERLSAILPGAGEVAVVGVAGERNGSIQFDGSMDVNFAHLRGVFRWLGIDVGPVPTDRLQQMMMQTQISATPEAISLVDLTATMDGSTLNGAATIALRSRPSFGANLSLDRFNADAYLVKGSTTRPAADQQSSTGETEAATAKKAPAANPVDPLDALAVLDAFDANLDLSVGQLTYQKRNIRNANVNALIYNGDLDIKQASVADFAGLKLGLSGKIARTDKGVLAENLSFNANGENLTGAAKIAGLGNLLNWQKLGPVSVSATLNENILAPEIDVSLDALDASVIVAGRADLFPLPKLDATISAQIANLQRVTRGLGLSYKPQGNPGAIEVNADIAYSVNSVSLKNVTGQVGKMPLSGSALYRMGKRPYGELNIETGHVRLDPFMPAGSKSTAATSSKKTSAKTSRSPAKSSSQTPRWSRTPIDVSVLKEMDGKVRMSHKAVSYDKIIAENVKLAADLKDGVLQLSDAAGTLFGGAISANSNWLLGDTLDLKTDLKVSGMQLKTLLQQTGNSALADGGINLNAALASKGVSEFDLVSNLNGTAGMDLTKVSVGSKKGQDGSLLDLLKFLAFLSGSDPSKSLADVVFASTITNGVANLDQAKLTSNIASGNASGTVDLPRWNMDVAGVMSVKQNALIGLLAQKAKMKSEYPFTLKGPIDAPNVKLDTGGLSNGGGLIIPLPNKLEKNGVGTLLRGILGATGGGSKSPAPVQQQAPAPAPVPANDGTIAPPPPPPGGSSSTQQQQQQQPSVEQQLLRGLGDLLKNR
ncbi:AsmA family protein [Terasakiella sp. A23]|uniref:AsmA family protein n=1 Tax=Terasakiella sp. FCG-A23 TaxID=3080561 RepID=UPI002955BC45|nr:AsmA family protein [Terasakiella sp. A23]MDV7340781.1 AsmA family protein [Terasakiella sp. A23]